MHLVCRARRSENYPAPCNTFPGFFVCFFFFCNPPVALHILRATIGYMGKVFHFIASKLTSY